MIIKAKAGPSGGRVRRGIGLGALAVLASAAALAVLTASPGQSPVTATRPVKSRLTDSNASPMKFDSLDPGTSYGQCLDSNAMGSVYVDPCNTSDSQNWARGWNVGQATEAIVDESTNRCLEADNEGDVFTAACNSSDSYQDWSWNAPFENGGDNSFTNVQTGQCMQVEGGTVLDSVNTEPCPSPVGPGQDNNPSWDGFELSDATSSGGDPWLGNSVALWGLPASSNS